MPVLNGKLGTVGEMLVSFSRADLVAGGAVDEHGRLTRTFLTLELGAKEQGGETLVVTEKMLGEMVDNFALRTSRRYRTPSVLGHPGVGEETAAKAWEKRIEAPAVGWVNSTEVKEDGLHVEVTFNPAFSALLLDGGYEFNSPSFSESWVDEFGTARGAVLIDVGILNYPLQEGLGSIMAASALAGGNAMDPELKKMLEEITARLEALEGGGGEERMGAIENSMKEYMEKMDAMADNGNQGKVLMADGEEGKTAEALKEDYTSAIAEIKSLSAKVNDEVATLREDLTESTKLTKALTDDSHAAECMRFLSAQIDLGKLAPGELADNWEREPAAAFKALGFTSLATAGARFDAMPKNAVVNLSGQQGRTGTTDHTTSTLSDESWNLSSMRGTLIKRFDGDESKARAHYESLVGGVRNGTD